MLSLLAWCLSGKSMSAPKIIVAINCGSMAESVESYDKVFKYVPVLIV